MPINGAALLKLFSAAHPFNRYALRGQFKKLLKSIWNPNKELLTKLKVLFMVSIPISMLLPIVLNQVFPNSIWPFLSIIWIVGIIIVRIIAAVRFSAIEGSSIESYDYKFLKKLSGKKRSQFIKTAIGIGIFLFVIGFVLLSLVNLIVPLEKPFTIFLVVLFFGIYVSGLRTFYLKLANNTLEDL